MSRQLGNSSNKELVAELRKWGSLKVGDQIPNEWGPPLTELLNGAADRIDELASDLLYDHDQA